MKKFTRISAAVVAGGLLALAVPTAAQAHVSASATSDAAGSRTVVTFSVPHGCEGSPTQIVTIDIPESIVSVTPTVNPLWSVEKVLVPLAEPIESEYGDPITDRVGQVVYTSTSGGLLEGFRDTFQLAVQLPAGEVGDVVQFETVQTCTEGTAEWVGDDAPSVTLSAAQDDSHGHSDGDAAAASEVMTDAVSVSSATQVDVLARVLGVAGLLVGLAGVTFALLTRRAARATS